MGISEANSVAVIKNITHVFDYIVNLPSIDGTQTVILNKQIACDELNITQKALEDVLDVLSHPNSLPENLNVILNMTVNPNNLNEIEIKWRFTPNESFL
mgnify:FL=1